MENTQLMINHKSDKIDTTTMLLIRIMLIIKLTVTLVGNETKYNNNDTYKSKTKLWYY